tara:strand:+ start:437 stop:2998 length:2562 start_codon:yes stop_codon:yes gene_type:complete
MPGIARQSLARLLFGTLALPTLPTAASEPAASAIEEVFVTARKRRENIQETPLAVTALTGADLREAGLGQTEELSTVVPSLHIQKGASNQIYIRGIGERTGYARVDPTVGIYLDDLYLPRSDGQLVGLLDLEAVQVLRGPQGTLFGKNTTGGAIVLTLEKPHDTFDAYIEGSLGNFNTRSAKAMINGALTDTIAGRLLLSSTKNDGFVRDAFTGERFNSLDQKALIGQLRWDINDAVTLDTLAYHGKVRENLPGNNCKINNENALFVNGLGLMWPGDTDATAPHAYQDNCNNNSQEVLGDLRVSHGPNPNYDKDLDTTLAGITANIELSEQFQLKAVAGYREETKGPALKSDNDGGPENFSEAIQIGDSVGRSHSLELQLNSSWFDERLDISTGVFYMGESNSETSLLTAQLVGIDAASLLQLGLGSQPTTPLVNGLPLVGQLLGSPVLISEFDLDNTTSAAYLQAVWEATEQWQLTGGLRYTVETRDSRLGIRSSDADAIANRLVLSGRFGPGSDGLHPYLGAGWIDDPVRIAHNLFADQNGYGYPDYPMAPGYLQRDQRKIRFTELTPMLSASYQFDDTQLDGSAFNALMVYGTWSNGFKSGFGEPLLTDGLQVIEPETVENWELGFKADLFSRALRLNGATYYMIFQNMQLNTVGTDTQGNLAVTHQNAGESSIQGAELELSWMPSANWMINFNYSNNNYRFTEFTEPDLITLALTGEKIPIDRSDEEFPLSPEESASASIQHTANAEWGRLTTRLDASYKSDIYHGLDRGSWLAGRKDKDLAYSEPYSLLGARISWLSPSEDLSVTLYGKNLLDKRYFFGTSVGDSLGTFNRLIGEPRTYGLIVRKQIQ